MLVNLRPHTSLDIGSLVVLLGSRKIQPSPLHFIDRENSSSLLALLAALYRTQVLSRATIQMSHRCGLAQMY